MDISQITQKLSKAVKAEILKKESSYYEDEEDRLLSIAKLLLPFTDDFAFCQAFDYLNCKTVHKKEVDKLRTITGRYIEFDELFGNLRHELRDIGHHLLENIRYGKRNENIDELLTKITLLQSITSSSKPNINLSTDSPTRCSLCNKDCLASYRILLGIITPLVEEIRNESKK